MEGLIRLPFRKINAKEEIKKAIEKNPELEKYLKEAQREYEDIKVGKSNKKFGQ